MISNSIDKLIKYKRPLLIAGQPQLQEKTQDMRNLLVFSVVIFLAFSNAEKARFDNYKVFSVEVSNEEQLKVLREMEEAPFSSYDFWKAPGKVGHSVDVMVPPHKSSEFEELMSSLKFETKLKISNVQE